MHSKNVNYGAWYVNTSQNAIRNAQITYQKIFKEKLVLTADYIPNAFLCKRKVFLKTGGFDTHYLGSYFEDTDFGLRISKFGSIKILSDAIIYHKSTSFPFNNLKKLFNYSFNFIYFCRKHSHSNSKLDCIYGLFRLKIRFTIELLKRKKFSLLLKYLIITPIEFIKVGTNLVNYCI